MEFLLLTIGLSLLLIIGTILTPSGECYYCGKRSDKLPPRVNGKKMCDDCWASGKGREGL